MPNEAQVQPEIISRSGNSAWYEPPTSPATPRRTESQRLASELKEQEQTVIEAIDEMIGSRSDSEFGLESFEKALMLMRSVRLALEDEAKKLEAAETTVVS